MSWMKNYPSISIAAMDRASEFQRHSVTPWYRHRKSRKSPHLRGVRDDLLVQLPALLDESLLAVVGPRAREFCGWKKQITEM